MVSEDEFKQYYKARARILLQNDDFFNECDKIYNAYYNKPNTATSYCRALTAKFQRLYEQVSEDEFYVLYKTIADKLEKREGDEQYKYIFKIHNQQAIQDKFKQREELHPLYVLGMHILLLFFQNDNINIVFKVARIIYGLLLCMVTLPFVLGYALFSSISLIFSATSNWLLDKKSDAAKEAFNHFLLTTEGKLFHQDFIKMVCREIFLYSTMRLDIDNMTEQDKLKQYNEVPDHKDEMILFYDSKWNNLSFAMDVFKQKNMNVVTRALAISSVAICSFFQKAFTILAELVILPLFKYSEKMYSCSQENKDSDISNSNEQNASLKAMSQRCASQSVPHNNNHAGATPMFESKPEVRVDIQADHKLTFKK